MRALLAVPLLIVALLAAGVAGRQTERRVLHTSAVQAGEQLRLHANALQALIDRYRALPAVLALDPELRAALGGTIAPAQRDALNLKLERVNDPAGASTLTLLDREGLAVAASNWRQSGSNVGHDYRFRPYFLQARAEGSGRFYAIGVTTGMPGYFLSEAIRDDRGAVLGVIVIKLELDTLEQSWSTLPDVVLLSDDHGISFLASAAAWRYRRLAPLDPATEDELARTQQYAGQTLQPLDSRTLESLAADGRRVQVNAAGIGGEYLWQSLALPSEGWTLHLLRDTRASVFAGRLAALAALGVFLTLLLFVLFLQQRLRLSRLRERSREELEQLVRQHTAVLRTAQDSVVEAAERAAIGQGRSLEHLPQGVSVIDADLKLLAWNRRYVEIFNYPSELMRAGRPIEDLLRHNARRGLLGSDHEDAVQRRLQHLRAAQPHMFEREWADGTVLEIRGNPLPGGGFVTSYADITSYRNTARELRTLAGSLERRVEQRTRDLDEARHEAERANRSKTRFVAAAVHDLLQPLNAARMFVSALRERLQEPAALQLADNVEDALAAEDAILSGLLDISRLESGAIETQLRELPLQDLFEVLARDFGILAQARGLRLRCVPTHALVRSDEALLRRILQNFLSNALSYTPAGGRVLLGCRRAGAQLRIEVWDNGCGIPEHRRAEIFEEFRRLDSTVAQNRRGAGLGLAIVERIARLLGHAIGLRSWPGRGSVFSVSVLLSGRAAVHRPATTAPAAVEEPSALEGRAVWCIDDDPRVRAASQALLESWGCRVTLAASAAQALSLCVAGAAPDLVLLDYRLGDDRGTELMPQLCAAWGMQPPVIVISAERDPELLATVRERQWSFLLKPVRPPALRALMRQLLVRGF